MNYRLNAIENRLILLKLNLSNRLKNIQMHSDYISIFIVYVNFKFIKLL